MNTEIISVPKEMLDKLIVYLHSVGDDGAIQWVDIIETYVELLERSEFNDNWAPPRSPRYVLE